MFNFFKKNTVFTSKATIIDQMNERRPLPIGMEEFDTWSDRIVSGCGLTTVDPDSLKFALANMILHLGPTESHKEDAFFIHSLRKVASNQIADAQRHLCQNRVKARLAAEEAKVAAMPVVEVPSDVKV